MDYMKKPIRCGGEIRNIIDYEAGESKKYKWGLWAWFYPIDKNDQRHDLCESLRKWLLVLKKTGASMEILIGGMFITKNPSPGHVDVICVVRKNMNGLRSSVKQQVYNLLTNGKHIFKTYRVNVIEARLTPKSQENDTALYDKALERFGFDKKHEPKPTIFRVCL